MKSYLIIALFLMANSFLFGQDDQHGMGAFEGKQIVAKYKIKKPGLFSRIEKGDMGIRFSFKNIGEENISIDFQLFVYEYSLSINTSENNSICIKPRKKKVVFITRKALKSNQDWNLENIKTSIVENCETE